jgi:hypothetical protein
MDFFHYNYSLPVQFFYFLCTQPNGVSTCFCLSYKPVLRIRIRIILGSRIHIKVKSRIRIRIEVKIQELWRLKMKPRRAIDSHNGGVETQNGAV